MRTLTIETPSGSFIAILPFDFTFVKSDSAFLLTPPASVAKIIFDESFATLQIAQGVIVKVQKQGINQKLPKGSASI